jgi:hypothetical protein
MRGRRRDEKESVMEDHPKPLFTAEIEKIWLKCGGNKDYWIGNPRAPEACCQIFKISDHGFLRFVSILECRIRDIEHEVQGRLAFKAGWRTNATTEQEAEYLDGCERVDWEQYKALGLTRYLDQIAESDDEYRPWADSGVKVRAEPEPLYTHPAPTRDDVPSQWQPIETAPKDGAFVFLYWPTMPITWYPSVGFHHGDGYGWELAAARDYGEVLPTHWAPMFPPPRVPGQTP